MIIWLFVINSYADNKKINMEDIAMRIAFTRKILKTSLRLILENVKKKRFLKFTLNENGNRS
jgi:hypothetical protein